MRLVAADRTLMKDWRVYASTRSGNNIWPDPETAGHATGTTNEDGRFAVPAMAVGEIHLVIEPPRELPVLPDLPRPFAVIAGRENLVEIPLRKPATITGVIRERGTGRPVQGIELSFHRFPGGKTVKGETDAQGRYTFTTLPGTAGSTRARVPRRTSWHPASNGRTSP